MKHLILCGLFLCSMTWGLGSAAQAQGTKKPAVSVAAVHVITGCEACETMLNWLKRGGVKLDMRRVEQGRYELYPTVVYSDKRTDHGDRMYQQSVRIPKEICVFVCSVGTN